MQPPNAERPTSAQQAVKIERGSEERSSFMADFSFRPSALSQFARHSVSA
jgi:hypothetical protein